MKISKTLMNALLQLVNGESIAASLLRKDFTDILLAEGMLTVQAHGSRRSFRAIDTLALKNFLQTHYEELRMIGEEMPQLYQTRSEQAVATGNSKMVKVRSCPGFPVNSYEPIPCLLCGSVFVVNPPEGSFMFINNWKQFSIPEDVIVIGIENMENFRMIRRQRKMFESILGVKHLLFVSRYPQSTDLRQWLQTIPNRYVHFGDFDLAGIHIYLTEFYRFLNNRSSFFIPTDIEKRLSNGSAKRYNDQFPKYHNICSEDRSIQTLIDLINTYHRSYDQEGYIEL